MRRIRWWSAAVLSAVVAVAGCGDPTSSEKSARENALDEPSVAQLEPRKVGPSLTDPEIRDPRWLSEHYVWLDRTADRQKKLVVFMPGTGNPPSSFQLVGKEAARLGYHVIVLSYPITWEILICKEDPDCERDVRVKVLDGKGPVILAKDGTQIDVTPPESIDNRLTKLLGYLAAHSPEEEGWSEFLHHGSPNWKKIVISGASFGGSQAALIAKLHRVHRVTLFAAPRDFSLGQKDSWIALGETHSKRYYGLVHLHDPRAALTLATWEALGMSRFGKPVLVEESAPPYENTHMLVTDLLPSSGTFANAHPSVGRDQFTPLTPDGTPALRDAWRHIFGAQEESDDAQDEDARDE